MVTSYCLSNIRTLLTDGFSAEELRRFCFQTPGFRPVYDQLAAHTGKAETIDRMLEHADRHGCFDVLLNWANEQNPLQYARNQPYKAQPGQTKVELMWIPAGEFLVGSDPRKDKWAFGDEQPCHSLSPRAYYLGKPPVTNAQYAAFVEATNYQTTAEQQGGGWVWSDNISEHIEGATWQHPSGPASNILKKDHHPVVQVSWYDAVAYCDWLSQVKGRKYRLPTEAEWEKGARGVDGRIFPWGNYWEASRCNSMQSGKNDTTEVGAYPEGKSPYGLLDMAGNVWEWTHSLFRPYPYKPTDGRESLQVSIDDCRVIRGGSFCSDKFDGDEYYTRCACRSWFTPDMRDFTLGFRVAMSL